MKIPVYALLAATLLASCSQAPAPTEETTAADRAENAQMASEAAAPAEAAVAKTSSATGTVEAVDATAGKITIAHGAVEALQWPAMTMAFKATPEQIASVQPGQQVQFEFTAQGMEATITRIAPAQ